MWIEHDTMNQIHMIQLQMWDELKKVLDKLELPYFFVHGSLLGAITRENFIIEDDDIDIALMREDYNRLVKEGNKYLSKRYFIQNALNDDFPLAFAKVRDNNTAFIQPILSEYNCNKGIYIDIFPIDYCPENKMKYMIFQVKEKIFNDKIYRRMAGTEGGGVKAKILEIAASMVLPSYQKAVVMRENMYSSLKPSRYVSVTGGKETEKRISREWFKETINKNFCGCDVSCPKMYSEYLTQIYGNDFLNHNPAEERMDLDNKVEISASILDFERSYICYLDSEI